MRFVVEERDGRFCVVDTEPPEGTPFKSGVVFRTDDKAIAQGQANHLNRVGNRESNG